MEPSSWRVRAWAVYSAVAWTAPTWMTMSPTPPAARASWYAMSWSETRPWSAMTVSWPDEKIRFLRVTEPMLSGEKSDGNAVLVGPAGSGGGGTAGLPGGPRGG